jgi:hypothetical protein
MKPESSRCDSDADFVLRQLSSHRKTAPALGQTQTSLFMVLGRVFSQDSEHNIDSLLRIAEADREIFSRESLARRKSSIDGLDVQAYVSDAHVPRREDFRGFRREVKEWRKIYETNYREVRNQIFAHAEVSQPGEVGALFAKTNIQELELLVTDLVTFHARLQGWLQNGTLPVAARGNSSVQELRKLPVAESRYTLQGRVIRDGAKPPGSSRWPAGATAGAFVTDLKRRACLDHPIYLPPMGGPAGPTARFGERSSGVK